MTEKKYQDKNKNCISIILNQLFNQTLMAVITIIIIFDHKGLKIQLLCLWVNIICVYLTFKTDEKQI